MLVVSLQLEELSLVRFVSVQQNEELSPVMVFAEKRQLLQSFSALRVRRHQDVEGEEAQFFLDEHFCLLEHRHIPLEQTTIDRG